MSSPGPFASRPPLIALVDRANRVMQADMVREAHRHGFTQVKQAHNAVFSTLGGGGARASDMAARAGITRQSMGEIVRELTSLGILTTAPDPEDRRAKLITYTPAGLELTTAGYQHILDLEAEFTGKFGADQYELVRDALEWVVQLLETNPAQ
ncbi:MarR family winged helix-turn-helix transcriptional regulator [Aeromicrobium sp. 9AM]|uniref:MarR family winged helix-turn-helix transcriptional regulator n=1 Tax=Aeromicrobium sp. 9AM TaxID=2653126 RepID=UPI0012F20AE0|nr:MarR family winged helix-turn-helix transcriptional regulator [Aeromicrobium sp. 9AM]VXA96840.1 MarR family transcriptional regulator [Aeromicrobium sp. 9AM]